MKKCPLPLVVLSFISLLPIHSVASSAELLATVTDSDTRQPIAARVYVRDERGEWLFVESADPLGTALPYREEWVPMPDSVELHTTVSPHPFRIDLEPGSYQITIERGKEYIPLHVEVEVGSSDLRRDFQLQRFCDWAARGWYSGETHVHRRIRELPNVMLAEDLNVAFPVTYWTTESDRAPDLQPSTLRRQGPSPFGPREDQGYNPIAVDSTHVIVPRNTEYEIFSVGERRHVLGALFILNHRIPFQETMPPVAEIARRAHEQGALLDLDKHSWPWSLMLVPVAQVDLYELSNNSVWRTKFGFGRSSVAPPEFMQVEMDEGGMTEWGWLQYGFETYYALLNCGFRLKPTAGTASGVHPVPLGYSRVYVKLNEPFTIERWLSGLAQGRSFVTTGPLLEATVQGRSPGHSFEQQADSTHSYPLNVHLESVDQLERCEVLVNGRVVSSMLLSDVAKPVGQPQSFSREVTIPVTTTSWIAVRCLTRTAEGRIRFAHSAPWFVQVGDQPQLPRREQIEHLIGRMREEIDRNRAVLSVEALAEFEQALSVYQAIGERVSEKVE